MASERQIAANRQNGKKGGPKTPRGKAASSMNRLTHGARSECVIIPGENPEEYEALYRSLVQHYQPVGVVEKQYVKDIAEFQWRLDRVIRFETGIMHSGSYEAQRERAAEEMDLISIPTDLVDPWREREYEEYEKAYEAAEEELRKPLALFADVFKRAAPALLLLARYETGLRRQLRNATRDFELAQARRMSGAAEAAEVIEGTAVDQTERAEARPKSQATKAAEVIDMPESDEYPRAQAHGKPETAEAAEVIDMPAEERKRPRLRRRD